MSRTGPPRWSTWMLERWAPPHNRESLIGDLIEQYQAGRSAMWYRRQVVVAIWARVVEDLRAHKLLALRTLAIWWMATFLLGWFTTTLRYSIVSAGRAAVPWGESEIVRQFWVWYGVPFVLVACLGHIAIGWAIARSHRRQAAAMVLLAAVFQLWPAVSWGSRVGSLLQAGLWPFWDYRMALMFQALCLFVAYPLCIVVGGLWGARPDKDTASPVAVDG